jgi:putative ABC transport system permease protein
MNRRSEIALLISLGATTNEIRKIFLYLGVVIGISGILVGVALGLGGIYILQNFEIIKLPADIYGTTHIPIDLDIWDFVYIVTGAFIIVVLSAIYPANRAKNIDIVKVLKNE